MICSSFSDMMENYNQGDLADIVRASGGGVPISDDDWQFPYDNITVNDFQSDFGDPFNNFRHPIFNDYDHLSAATSSSSTASFFADTTPGFFAGSLRPPSNNNNNIFSKMLQISPNQNITESQPTVGTGILKTSPTTANEVMICSETGGLVENGDGVRISSPRNTGIKRRKSLAKKVVCIPAPTPANSRPSGEVVPSDLWAWRKYGQKPIKGSPYPRGYYRCSSSKGCSARKQVERSRTDPNMLVITYTSEHNHPWPTQRNALAGSTRAQPNKAGTNSKSSLGQKKGKEIEEEKEKPNLSDNSMFDSSLVKEEMDEQMDMDDGFGTHKSAFHDSGNCDDFFADLGEIEADSLSLMFSQGFDQERTVDHFSIFDWSGNNSGSNNKTFLRDEEDKEGRS